MLCSTGDDVERERDYMETLKSNIVDGVISGVNNLDMEEYTEYKKPLIMLDLVVNSSIPVVVSDHVQGGKLAAEKFIDSGCKNIIHICSRQTRDVISYNSHITLEKILNDKGISVKQIEIEWSSFDFEGYLNLAKKILIENSEIDGVFAADMAASAFLKAAIQLGKSVPEEFSVVAYDGTYTTNSNILSITTVVQQVNRIAEKSVEVIIDIINGEKIKESYIEIPVFLRDGETTRS